jgi:hypothetical protein
VKDCHSTILFRRDLLSRRAARLDQVGGPKSGGVISR